MTPAYRVFVAAESFAFLQKCTGSEKRGIVRLLDDLALDPFRNGDYVEMDPLGRPVQVVIVGSRAVCFWVDHAVKEVKVIDLRFAGQ
jgi:hypothetical protein